MGAVGSCRAELDKGGTAVRTGSMRVGNFARSAALKLDDLATPVGAKGASRPAFLRVLPPVHGVGDDGGGLRASRPAFLRVLPPFREEQNASSDFYDHDTTRTLRSPLGSPCCPARLTKSPRYARTAAGAAMPRRVRPGRAACRIVCIPFLPPRPSAVDATGESAPACSPPTSCDDLLSPAPGGGPRSARGRPGGRRK